jgi:site-specific recombinase XerD
MRISRRVPKRRRTYIERYIRSQADIWQSEVTRQSQRYIIYHLLEWLECRALQEKELTPELLDEFIRFGSGTERSRFQQKSYRVGLRRYLSWCQKKGKVKTSATELVPLRRPCWLLPLLGKEFLSDPTISQRRKAFRTYRATVARFHVWLESQKVRIEAVDESFLLKFDEHLRLNGKNDFARQTADQRLRVYLSWLHQRGTIKLTSPNTILPAQATAARFKVALCDEALAFLEFVAINRRESTVKNYKNALDHFYFYLHQMEIRPQLLQRKDLEGWLRHLNDKGLGPTTRKGTILCVRYYLFWLEDNGKLETDVDSLLRLSDCPKIPEYLPKPLSPTDDAKLQSHLASSDDVLKKALLLIRLTGLRIGEAVGLPGDALWQDHAGHHYLKIPLGKLDKERMVPVDERIRSLVEWHLARTRRIKGKSFSGNLMVTGSGAPLSVRDLRFTLHNACRDVKIFERVNVHRLRHTYATALLNGGMSLLGVMKVLGHHSTRMTLRYAAVSPENVRQEYLAAIGKIEQQRDLNAVLEKIKEGDEPDISRSFADLKSLIRHLAFEKDAEGPRVKLLIKRVQRLQSEVEQLLVP